MSPRRKMLRKVMDPPPVKGFRPYGPELVNQEPVYLLYEEYEAMRLSDYNKLNHHHASVMMNVSRPTFTRIYASALQKIATAFVEGRNIAIEGGKVYFDSNWHHCKSCLCYFNNPDKEISVKNCPLCGSLMVIEYDFDNSDVELASKNCDDLCICPNCGYEQQHHIAKPCAGQQCPKCNYSMKRKGSPNC